MALRREIHERYRLGPRLGGGARTSVHAAAELATGANFVVKRIAPGGDPLDGQNFLRFGAALASLRIPGLPSLHDFGLTPDGGAFLVLEPLAGRSLSELVEGSPGEILPVLLQIVDAVEQLSERGVPFGNLSPENVLLASNGSGEQIKLFGLGTALLHAPAAGTPDAEYAAPEQIAGEALDGRADVYSFGRLACRLLGIGIGGSTERGPELHLPLAVSFELEDAEALRLAIVRCLATRPAERPTWGEIRESLRTALRGPAAQPSLGDKTNPVYIPPEALGGAASALRFEEVSETSLSLPEPPALAMQPEAPLPPAPPTPPIPPTPPTPLPPPPTAPEIAAVAPPLETPPSPPPTLPRTEPKPAEVSAQQDSAAETPPDGELFPPLEELLAEPTPSVGALVPPAPGAVVAPPPAPRPIRAPGAGKRRLTTVGAVVIGLVLLGLLFIWLRDREGEEFPGPLPPPPAEVGSAPLTSAEPAPPMEEEPAPSLDSNLIAARTALEAGDDEAARRALAAITPEVAAAWTPEEIEERRQLEESLGKTKSERWVADLRRALRSGSASLLRSSARALDKEPALVRSTPGLRADLAKAHEAIDLFDRLQRANRTGDSLATIEVAGALAQLFPRDKTTPRTRERAAAAIETEAERLAQSGNLRGAIERLEALGNAWPERDGVSDRIARLRTAADVDERLDRVLANAAAAERRRRPDEALRLLQAVEPSPPYAARFREAIERVQADWKRLDQAAPAISLRQGSPAEFEKGANTRIALDVSDDFQVAKVALFARVEGGAWQQLELRSSGGFYSAEISPAFHQNKDIQWYATASDLSGHSAEFGNAQSPRALRRKKWFDRLRGKEGSGG